MSNSLAPRVVVSLGTDHHKFNRLVDWIDDWLAGLADPPECLVQYGGSRVPSNANGVTRMPREELLQFYSQASVVVVQGGPGSILDARAVGHVPIAVPRRPELHEVVDGHQIAFTRTMAEYGEAIAVESSQALMRELDRALLNPESMRTAPRFADADAAAAKLKEAVDHLGVIPQGPMALRRLRQVIWLPR